MTARDTKSGRSRTAWVRRKCISSSWGHAVLRYLCPLLDSLLLQEDQGQRDGVVFGFSLGTLAFVLFIKTRYKDGFRSWNWSDPN